MDERDEPTHPVAQDLDDTQQLPPEALVGSPAGTVPTASVGPGTPPPIRSPGGARSASASPTAVEPPPGAAGSRGAEPGVRHHARDDAGVQAQRLGHGGERATERRFDRKQAAKARHISELDGHVSCPFRSQRLTPLCQPQGFVAPPGGW